MSVLRRRPKLKAPRTPAQAAALALLFGAPPIEGHEHKHQGDWSSDFSMRVAVAVEFRNAQRRD